ncbi:MAG: PKD domain-containing protein [Bacteroidota bacterium]
MNLIKLAKASCVSVLCVIISINSYAQPTANFTATPTSGCAPLLVNFTDQSTGNPTSWRWDLGNGTISQLQNASVVYFNPGQYSVKLKVINAAGTDSIIRTQYINVYAKPTIDFSASAYAGCPPVNISFTDLSTPGSGTNSSWNWDLGNGTSSNLQNPSIVYNNTGSYSITLLVTNSFGCTSALTKDTIIRITDKPVASFVNSSTANCGAPLTINFTDQSTGTGNLSYSWSFGDGTTSTDQNPSHTYITTGNFSPKLIVYNQSGCSDTIIRTNAINIANNITMFTVIPSVCANTPITITNSTTPNPINVLWIFGDGTTSTNTAPVKSYATPGTYQIKMINNYGICMDSMTRTITVMAQPTAEFTASPLSSCYAPLTVHFTNSSANAVSYSWNFGDGGTSSLANPTHLYGTQGNYSVTLTTTAANGCTKTTTMSQYINIQLPVVSVNQLPRSGCAPFEWTFHHTVLGGDSIVSYHWDFGDGNSSNLQSPTHVFDSGSFTITLIIITSTGCTDTVRYINGIRAGVRPHAAFTANPRNTCAETPVIFSDLSTPLFNVSQWLWDFGDGGTSASQNPSHTYQDTGYFTVQLITIQNGCPDTLIVPDYTHIFPPIAKFKVINDCSNRYKKTFIDSSIGADTWLWSFGDGSTSTEQNPIHNYTSSGSYTVKLTVHNNTSGCEFTKTTNIFVVNQLPDFVASDTVICKCNPITFTVTNVNTSLFSLFKWNFGDFTSGSNQPLTKNYCIPGIYTVKLYSTDMSGCKDTIIKPRYIKVNGPTANFGASVNSICSSSSVRFSDSSITDGRNGLAKWIWNYGDGNIETTLTRTSNHIYTSGGIYTVSLTVIDSSGCADVKTRSNLINVFHPSASFNTYDSISCPSHGVTFNNTSTGAGLTYLWNFGDRTTSTSQSPSHIYTASGNYSITLIVFDQNGCSDTSIRTNLVRVVTPSARFAVSDTLGACPPMIVNFTNNSLNFTTLSWNFGDNNSSVEPNPSHIYNVAGTFTARLTITGPGGCVSTKQRTIVVRGPGGRFTYGPLSGCVPTAVNFSANTRGASSYVWDNGDGSTNISTDSAHNHNYLEAGSFVPKLILSDTAGCIVPIIGRDTIRIYDIASGFNFNAPTFCNNGDVQFNNTTTADDVITGYTWNFGDSTSSSGQSPVHHYTTSGLFYPKLIATSLHGCRDTITSTIPIKIVASPQGIINQTANGCTNLTVTFTGRLERPDTSLVTWEWNFGNNNTSNSMTPISQVYNVAGTYPVKLFLSNSTGCKDTVNTTVEAYAVPTVSAGADMMICKGNTATLQATGASTYIWTPTAGLSCTNCANPLATPTSPIEYIVTGSSIHGCSSRDSIKIDLKFPFTMTASNKDSMCVGSSLRIAANGAYTYTWSPSTGLDNPNTASPLATPSTTTTYQVIGKDDKNCFSDTAYVPVIVFENPTVEAGNDRTLNVGQSIDLIPQISTDVIDARWSPTGSIFRDIFPGVTVRPNITTTYTVVVTNRGGCTASDQLTVNVLCNGANMFIPNTFSPNGDGMNDLFYPRGSGIFTIKRIKIYSRWGEVIFEKNNFNANDVSKAWDGTFKGKNLSSDVFVYVVEVVCDDNTMLTFKGNVALIK